MSAPKGNRNGSAAWVGQFAPAGEKKVQVGVKVPVSMAELLVSIPFPGFSWPNIFSSYPLLKSLSH